MTAPEFEIEIVSQGWITEDEESMRNEHGEVRLVIGGETSWRRSGATSR